jgi:hypothetical protein
MIKSKSIRSKKPKVEEKVEDIYGVHFKYKDLFSRLLKVQKERKVSEERSPVPRMPSFDSVFLRPNNSNKLKKDNINKKSSSIANGNPNGNKRSLSVRKLLLAQTIPDKKIETIKSYSPNQKRPKKLSTQTKPSKKHLEKKNTYTLRLSKKHFLKIKDI